MQAGGAGGKGLGGTGGRGEGGRGEGAGLGGEGLGARGLGGLLRTGAGGTGGLGDGGRGCGDGGGGYADGVGMSRDGEGGCGDGGTGDGGTGGTGGALPVTGGDGGTGGGGSGAHTSGGATAGTRAQVLSVYSAATALPQPAAAGASLTLLPGSPASPASAFASVAVTPAQAQPRTDSTPGGDGGHTLANTVSPSATLAFSPPGTAPARSAADRRRFSLNATRSANQAPTKRVASSAAASTQRPVVALMVAPKPSTRVSGSGSVALVTLAGVTPSGMSTEDREYCSRMKHCRLAGSRNSRRDPFLDPRMKVGSSGSPVSANSSQVLFRRRVAALTDVRLPGDQAPPT